jgi:hypothetical protein
MKFAMRLPLLITCVVLFASLSGCSSGHTVDATTPEAIRAAVAGNGEKPSPEVQAERKAAAANTAAIGEQMLAAHNAGKSIPGARQP